MRGGQSARAARPDPGRARDGGFDHQRDEVVQFAPLQVRVVDFSTEQGGITIQ